MNNFKQTKTKLRSANLKATQQRMVILNSIENSKKHPTAESIYESVKANNPSLSLATVYSTLDTFVDNGLVNKVLVQDGAMRYDAHTDVHNHIYCTNTNEIIDFEDHELQALIEDFFKRKDIENLNIKDISLHIQGEKIDKRKTIKIN
jgi:Fur family transcriptional regulator, peroxide stress response regulator